ncbi:MAG: gliding motility-associated C-terminal domain-containing protein [Bacteroidia bacterium]
MKKIILVFSALFSGITQIHSQTVDASPETQTICGGGTANLTAVVTPGAGTPPTNSYTISSIAYTPDPYVGSTVVSGMGDDTQSPMMPIGFNFCFFGTTYSNFFVGSNGWVAFSSQPTTYTSATIPSTGATVPKNCIMGPWQDWYPGLSAGCVTYQVYGSAPFRRLVVSWNASPMFSCTTTYGTFQITIYETTNIIENYIQLKPACLSWAGGTAVQGLHNAAGTVAFTVPGRNSTAWTAANEGWRYTPNGTSLYQVNWYILPANTLVGTGTSITVTPPASPQFYYAQVVDLNACTGSGGAAGTNTDTVVVLSQTPAVDAGSYAQICPGTSTTLNGTAPTATSFSWSPAGSLSSSTISNPVSTPGATTTYTLTVMDAMGCSGSDTVTVALANPAPTTSASPSIMCQGSSSSLTATGGGTYSWSPATGLSSTTIANPVATPSTDITYTVTVTGSGGCTATSSVSLTVIPAPPIDAGASVNICTGGSTVLNASGGNSYVWSPGTGLSSTTASNPTANPASTTTYTVVGTDLNGCTASDNVTVTVNPNPVVDAGANTTICPSASITLNGTGASTYSWTPAGSLSNPSISNPVAHPASTTTYTVTGTSSFGCTGTDVVTISINPINVFTTGTATICSGGSTTISAFGAANYVWSPAATLSNATVSSPVATPVATTTYTVVGTNAAGCNDTAFVTITVTPAPTVDAGLNTNICAGSSTVLNASGATSYSWSPGTGLSSTTVSNPTASPASTTTYTVTGTQGGCTATDVVTVTVNPVPVVDAGTGSSVCAGTGTTLNGSGATTYLWAPAASLSSATVANPTATPSVTTTYTVTGTGAGGCSSTDTVTIFVGGMLVTASSSASTICAGSSATLSVAGGTSFNWSPSTGLSSTTVSNPVATPASTTTYTVVASSGSCTNSATVTVTVTPLPSVNAGSTATICSGSSTVLGATGATTYVWSPSSGLSSSTSANPTANPVSTILYTVTGTQAGCSATDTVSVIVEPAPVASAGSPASICGGTSTTLNATGGGTYSWLPAGTLSSSAISNPVATPASTTTYTVTVMNGSGCTATATVTITVTPAPVANAGTDVAICNGGSTTLSATGGGTYSWSPGTGLSSTTSATPTAAPAGTTSYTVTVTSGTCTSTDVVVVTVNSSMSIAAGTSTSATCGNIDGTATAGTITGGGMPYTYAISGGPTQSSPAFTGLTAGSYTVTVTDNGGCTASETITVGSVLGITASFSGTPTSGTAPLTVNLSNSSSGASGYIWDFDNGTGSVLTNPSAVYGANGTYTIMLVAYNGTTACADTATLEINVFDAASMIVPNVFTPNGDGHNDMFRVIGTGLKTVEGTMYNRWGKKIAEWSGDQNAGWDGNINGKAAQDGTYFYIIKATGMDGKEYDAQGYVQVLNE